MSRSHVAAFVVLVAAAATLVWRQSYFYGWVDDDAFISFRYARNLVDGHGLVFNVGERVEGYTNFLWTVILAGLHALGLDFPTAARIVGGICSVATLGVLVGFAGTRWMAVPDEVPRAARPFLALVGALVLCFSDSWAAWAAGGLENTLSALLVVTGILAYVRGLENDSAAGRRRAWLACAAVFACAVLNHPSNVLFTIPIVGHAIGRARAGERLGPWRPALGLFVAIVAAWTAWRLAYYGDLLPNTFHAKVGFTRFVVWRGLRFMGEVLRALPLAYGACLVLGVLALRRAELRGRVGVLGGAVLLYTAYVIEVGGEQFPALRSMVVLLPLFALVLQCLAYEACRVALRGATATPVAPDATPSTAANKAVAKAASSPTAESTSRAALAVTIAALVVAAHAVPLYFSPRNRILDRALYEGRTALSTTAALRLKELLPPDTLFAHSGAGLIAFYTNFPWIDTLGLTDRHIARTKVTNMGQGAAGHEKGDGAYVWSRQPDYVMFPGYPISNQRPGTKGGRELVAIPGFRSTYRPVRLPFEFQGPNDSSPRQHILHLWQRVPSPSAGS